MCRCVPRIRTSKPRAPKVERANLTTTPPDELLSHLLLKDLGFCFGTPSVELLPVAQEVCCVFHSLDSTDKSVIYALESAVIQWSHRVQVVLKRESSQPLLQGENPTPKVELEFWKSRWARAPTLGSRCLREDQGLGEAAVEAGPTSGCFSSPLEQTARCSLGQYSFSVQ